MICSDWISIICASISLVVTIVIAGLQLWQSGRMEKFERRQDERDERRHAEEVKSQAVSFISKHYADRGLIPLCAMAAMHNDLYYYSREMYREFCCMTLEAQNRVLEYCGLDLHVTGFDESGGVFLFFKKIFSKTPPKNRFPFQTSEGSFNFLYKIPPFFRFPVQTIEGINFLKEIFEKSVNLGVHFDTLCPNE